MDSGEAVVVECELINRTTNTRSAPIQSAARMVRERFERPGCCGRLGPGVFQRDWSPGGSVLMSLRCGRVPSGSPGPAALTEARGSGAAAGRLVAATTSDWKADLTRIARSLSTAAARNRDFCHSVGAEGPCFVWLSDISGATKSRWPGSDHPSSFGGVTLNRGSRATGQAPVAL